MSKPENISTFDVIQFAGELCYPNTDGTAATVQVYVDAVNSAGQVVLAHGATKPADNDNNYAIGAIFIHTDGAAGTALYINEGTATNADFNAVATSAGTTASAVTLADEHADTTCFPVFAATATGDVALYTDNTAGYTFNSHTGVLTAAGFAGPLVGNVTGAVTGNADTASAVAVANEATDTTCFPLFATAATGNLPGKTNASLTYNSNTGALAATSFTGALNGSGAGITANTVSPKALPAVPTDMGNATITVDLSNSNGANVTNLVTDGSVTAGSFSGSASGLTAGSVKATALQNAAADLGDADVTVDLSNTNAGNVTNLTIDGAITTGSLAVTGASTIAGDITHTGKLIVRTVTDGGMDATNGTVGEIVFNSVDTSFYGCTVTGTPGTWAKLG